MKQKPKVTCGQIAYSVIWMITMVTYCIEHRPVMTKIRGTGIKLEAAMQIHCPGSYTPTCQSEIVLASFTR